MTMQSTPKKIAVTGAAGQICYSLLFRLANGDLYGKSQPIELRLLDLPQAQDAVRGVVMELEDCAFPLLHSIVTTDDPRQAFDGVDASFLVGSRRGQREWNGETCLQRMQRSLRCRGGRSTRSPDDKLEFWSLAIRPTPTLPS